MNQDARNISVFSSPEPQLEDLKQERKKIEQKLLACEQPVVVQHGKGLETEDSLRRQGEVLKLKRRLLNLQGAIKALERMTKGDGKAESAFGDAAFALEAIISYRYRPALVFDQNHSLRKSDIDDLGLMEDGKRSWKDLISFLNLPAVNDRKGLSSLGQGVGRVEHANGAVVGTAWSFGKRHWLSNRHVLLNHGWYYQAKSPQDLKWIPVDGRQGMLNFSAVDGIEQVERTGFSVEEIVANPGADASRIVADKDSPFVLEPVLDKSEIVGVQGNDDALKGRLVAVIGHPTNQEGNPTDEFDSVFGGAPLKLKRFMPGRLCPQKPLGIYPTNGNHGFPVLMHDCSTLKGASGSCLIDLGPNSLDPEKLLRGEEQLPATFGKVIGLHFGGLWSDSNYAVPTWALPESLLKQI